MNNAPVAWRTSLCLIALIVASALPAEAQPRTLQQVDDAVKQQQASLDQLKLDQLKASIEKLTRENDALRQSLAESNRKPAPPEAWWALGAIGSISVVAWAAVTLVREWPSRKAAEAQLDLRIQTGIEKQAKSIESAAEARLKTMLALVRDFRSPAAPPAPGKGIPE